MKKTVVFSGITIILLFSIFGCATTGSTASRDAKITRETIRDYVCRVNVHHHPNMDKYLRNRVYLGLSYGSEEGDQLAFWFSANRRGGSGSGFVYVDDKGNNYIITNYHVVAQAYTFTVTFENEDNSIKQQFTNLTVFREDRENDLAILQFSNGEKPFKAGLPISRRDAQDLDTILSAGFPGIQRLQPSQWRIDQKNVTSARHVIRGKTFILHNANQDGGNSGGPLLAYDSKNNLIVQGVINAKWTNIDGGNLAIPSNTLLRFLDSSFAEQKTNERTLINTRVNDFITALNGNFDELEVFTEFISPFMLADNPEFIMADCYNLLGVMGLQNSVFIQVARALESTSLEYPVIAVEQAAVLLKIILPAIQAVSSDSKRQGIRAVKTERNSFGGYTVLFNIGGDPYRSDWIENNGVWRISNFMYDDGEFNNIPFYPTWHPQGLYVNYRLYSSRDVDWYEIDAEAGNLIIRAESTVNIVSEVQYEGRRLPGGNERSRQERNVIYKEWNYNIPQKGKYLIGIGSNSRGIANVPYSLFVTVE
ncbi:MAG: serine protease [Treponema sp.]|nr:serine protease [Treponema sp.]